MLGLRTLVRFPLLSEFPGSLDSALAPVLPQILIRHDFTANKFILKIGTSRMSEGQPSGVV